MKGKAKLRRPRKEPKEFGANLELLQDQKQIQSREDERLIQKIETSIANIRWRKKNIILILNN